MKRSIALPLALGIALAGPVSADAGLSAYGPVRAHRVLHHRSVVARAPAPLAALVPAKPAFGDNETDGLSRNPDDCVTYGCVGVGGG